jgi:hypothetical protein
MNGQQYRSHGAMRVIIMNGLARKPPWGNSKMTAMPPRQGAWLASCVDEPGVQLSKGKKIMEGMSLSQPESRMRTLNTNMGREEERRGGSQSCKLRCAGVGTRKW